MNKLLIVVLTILTGCVETEPCVPKHSLESGQMVEFVPTNETVRIIEGGLYVECGAHKTFKVMFPDGAEVYVKATNLRRTL